MSEIQIDYDQLANTVTRLTAHADDLTTASTLIDTQVGVIGLATATTAARDFQTEVDAMIDVLSSQVTTLATNVQGSVTSNQQQDDAAGTTFTGGTTPDGYYREGSSTTGGTTPDGYYRESSSSTDDIRARGGRF